MTESHQRLIRAQFVNWRISGVDFFRRDLITLIEKYAHEHITLMSAGPNNDPVFYITYPDDASHYFPVHFVPPVNPVGHYYTKTGEHFRCLPGNEQ